MVYLLSPGDCCGPECVSCGFCGTQQDELQVTLAGFTDIPDGDYIVSCSETTACFWEHIFEVATTCGAKTIRVFLESTRWLVRLEQLSPFPTAIYVRGNLTIGAAPHDCQPNNLDIPVTLNDCGGESPTIALTAI